ncbi:MAG: apolipoprotein N-acyltransferase [Xanthobacteraceae bacterium]|nr:apolipoprotein N-acyltransferase [Xanthobacteraceae bacterium]
MTLKQFSHSVVLAWGWRRAAIAFLAGAVSALGLAPIDAWPVLFLTFPVLVWLIDGTAAGRYGGVGVAAITGWWFGFGYFVAGLYWIGHAFLVDAQTFGWLLPFAVTILPAGLALFTAVGCAAARLLWTRGPSRILALALALTLSEWLRGNVLTGFPWNSFGYTLTGSSALAQSASLIGLWGLTFVAVAVFASTATLTDDRNETKRPWLPVAASVALLVGLAIFGTVRLAKTPTAFVDGVKLRIMQPNLSQDDKFNYSAKASVMRRYLALSDKATGPQSMGVRDATHLIWPESAFPFFLTREVDALAQIAALLPQGTVLITGGVREPDTLEQRQAHRAYNSIYVIDHDGSVLSVYDKVHLVPFGEYLPFQKWAERLGFIPLTKVPGFLSGDRRRLIEAPRAPPFLPLICYEIIFPDEAVPAGDRPGWLLNLTNDGWFGISSGPYQHFRQARLQAIERGLPLVRAANTGISAVVDPLGRVVASLPLGTEGVLDAQLPKPVAVTFYRRYGGGLVAAFLFVILIGLVRRRMTSG